MPFADAHEVHHYIGGVFVAAFADPEVGPKLSATGLVLRFALSDNFNRWTGFLARMSYARVIHGSNTMEGVNATLDDAVAIIDGVFHPAVTSVGVRPTIGDGRVMVETFLLDHSEDLYGRRMRVAFVPAQSRMFITNWYVTRVRSRKVRYAYASLRMAKRFRSPA